MVKNVAKIGFLSLCFAGSGLATGCADSGDDYDDIEERNAKIVENLLDAGFSEEDIVIRESDALDGELGVLEPQLQVFLDGDVHVTLEASEEMLNEDGLTFRHWRTPNLVNNNTTICLAKVTSASGAYSSYALTSAMRTGVNRARNNFNNVNSFGLNFKTGNATLSGGGNLSHSISGCNYSIFIYEVSGGAGGSAGFPSGGAPYSQVRLNSGLAGYSLDVHEHVATHEIGHAIGLRHADWKTRASCGQNSNEGQSGAVHISGTADQTTNSIMASCFSGGSNGEFRGEDKEALGAIY